MAGLWRKNPATPEGKYLVKRRDGTIPEWPNFVIGARDPAAAAALLAYAREGERLGFDPQYIADVRELANEFTQFRASYGAGDPSEDRCRADDPATIAEMRDGMGL